MLHINPKRKTSAGPSFSPSPIKKKKLASDEAEEDDGWDLQCTQVDMFDDGMAATQVDFIDDAEEKEEVPAFRLNAFGEEEILSFVEESMNVPQIL